MGWWSKTWKKVKNVFKKVTKVVKKVVKAVGKTAKKVWNKVKGVAKKFSKGMSKLGPFANIAMNFIPGFGQLWSAYGIWGQLAKGALVGFATTGEASGAILGAATMGAADIFKNMQGANIAEKVGNWFEGWTNDSAIGKAIGQTATKFKDAFKPAGTQPVGQGIFDKHMATEYATPKMNFLTGTTQEAYEKQMADTYAKTKVGEDIFGKSKYGYTGTGAQSMGGSLLNRVKDAIPNMSSDPMNSAQATAGMWNPDTSPLQSVATNTTASETHGQAGYGRDPNEELIRSLGLKSLLEQYNASIA